MDIERPKIAAASDRSEPSKIDLIRHQVIGHFRLLAKGRSEPVLSFVHPHWRGRAENGIKIKNYDVHASRIPFAPPTMTILRPAPAVSAE